MKTTEEILFENRKINSITEAKEYINIKWYSEEEIEKAINKLQFDDYLTEGKLVSVKELKKQLFGDEE